jgi:hypothetical protein
MYFLLSAHTVGRLEARTWRTQYRQKQSTSSGTGRAFVIDKRSIFVFGKTALVSVARWRYFRALSENERVPAKHDGEDDFKFLLSINCELNIKMKFNQFSFLDKVEGERTKRLDKEREPFINARVHWRRRTQKTLDKFVMMKLWVRVLHLIGKKEDICVLALTFAGQAVSSLGVGDDPSCSSLSMLVVYLAGLSQSTDIPQRISLLEYCTELRSKEQIFCDEDKKKQNHRKQKQIYPITVQSSSVLETTRQDAKFKVHSL